MTMAHQDAWGGDTGLEDFNTSDISMPRLNIDHADNVFKDSLSNDTFESLNVVLLGLHKSRIMWPGDVGDDPSAPLCKSPDFAHGFPNMDPEVGADLRFPWAAQDVYKIEDAKPLMLDIGPTQPAIGCDKCKFKEWNTDPTGKKPWCSEEWVFPLVYQSSDGSWNPALWGVKRSALSSAKKYVSPFAAKKMPLFVVHTTLSLNANRRGTVKYSTPVFTKGAPTPEQDWMDYREQFISAKDYLKMYPMPKSDDDEAATTTTIVENDWDPAASAQPTASKPEPAAPTPPAAKPEPKAEAPAPVVIDAGDDDEPPF